MSDADWGWWCSVVVGDQGPLDRGAELPVAPDRGGQGQQPLRDPEVQTPWMVWAPWCSRPSWSLRVSMIASTHWRTPPRLPNRYGSSARSGRASSASNPARTGRTRARPGPCRPGRPCPDPAPPGGRPGPAAPRRPPARQGFGLARPQADRHAVGAGQQIELEPPVPAAVAAVIAVAGPAARSLRLHGLAAGAAGDRGGVQQPPVVTPRRRAGRQGAQDHRDQQARPGAGGGCRRPGRTRRGTGGPSRPPTARSQRRSES